jgi:hypothetical protein
MPTIMRQDPYRFFFYADECEEPPHVHVERDDRIAKFWLDPVRLCRSGRFRPAELADIGRIVVAHQNSLLEAWDEYFRG